MSIAAALATVGLKAAAYLLTGSVGLLSDAAESSANLIAAVGAFWALSAAARPPDEEHALGHTKAEFFSSALKGALAWPRRRSSWRRLSAAFSTPNRS